MTVPQRRARSHRHRQSKGTGPRFPWALAVLVLVVLALWTWHTQDTIRDRTGARERTGHLPAPGAGRNDASRVLPESAFADPEVRHAYAIARRIPETLNHLYCWCGCIERGMRSNLECFETDHAEECGICLAGAEIAWEMKQRGITDPAEIQRVLDERYGPGG